MIDLLVKMKEAEKLGQRQKLHLSNIPDFFHKF